MTSRSLAHAVCKSVTGHDLGTASFDLLNELLDSLNLVLSTWLAMLPQERRTAPFAPVVNAPVSLSVQVTQGSRAFTYVGPTPYPAGGFASESTALGATVFLDGAPTRNMLVAEGQLLHPYTGQTGTVTMTLHGDALHLPLSTWQVESEVRFAQDSQSLTHRRVLTHNPDRPLMELSLLHTGEPEEWWMEPLQTLAEQDARAFVMRVWPLPDRLYTLHCQIGQFPTAFTMEDIYQSRSLPFLPLEASLFQTACRGAFAVTSSRRRDGLDANALVQAGQAAETQLQTLMRPLSSQPGQVGTPYGY